MNDWKNVDKLFTGNIIGIRDSNQQIITPQYLKEENPEEFEITVMTPVGGDNERLVSLLNKETLTFHRDGSMERKYVYNTFSKYSVGQIHMLSPIGQKMLYNHIVDKYGKENVKESKKEI